MDLNHIVIISLILLWFMLFLYIVAKKGRTYIPGGRPPRPRSPNLINETDFLEESKDISKTKGLNLSSDNDSSIE